MKIPIAALCVMFFVGCAAPTAMVEIPNISESESIEVIDLRPGSEKESKMFSLSITSDAYGTYRRGDELLEPPAIRILQHRAHEKFAASGQTPEIKVHHLVVYMNLQSELRRGVAGGFLGGPLGAAIATSTKDNVVDGVFSIVDRNKFDSLAEDEYKRALYTEKENPNKASVLTVYLDGEIDGKRTFVKSMTPTALPSEVVPYVAAVETAIEYFLQQY